MIVYICNVLALQLVAEVVDFVFKIECTVHVETNLATVHQCVHLCQGIIGELHHLVHVLILTLGEMLLLALHFARNGTCHIIAGITDTLQFRYLTEHGANLGLRVITEMSVTHLVKIFGNLNLHIVGDAFIFLNACEKFGKLGIVFLLKEFPYHTKHTLHTL